MSLADKLRELSEKATHKEELLETEEATKTALVLPFLAALGYDVFNLDDVMPEYTADVGTKRGEKVDYAVLQDGKPVMLIECKKFGTDLDQAHVSQLYRYFSVTPARIAVLTNGVHYRFYSDLDEPNRMDADPFWEFDLSAFGDDDVSQLEKLTKGAFDLEEVVRRASTLKYTNGIKRLLSEEWANPSDEFVRLFASRVYSGQMRRSVIERFSGLVKQAFHEFITDRVNQRLASAMERTSESSADTDAEGDDTGSGTEGRTGIKTTEDEWEGYYIVKAIVSRVTSPSRVYIRDHRSYCSILLDDSQRKLICRLHFDRREKQIGLLDERRKETLHPIKQVDEIYQFADQICDTVRRYDQR